MNNSIILFFALLPLTTVQVQQPGPQRPTIPYTDECLQNTTERTGRLENGLVRDKQDA